MCKLIISLADAATASAAAPAAASETQPGPRDLPDFRATGDVHPELVTAGG